MKVKNPHTLFLKFVLGFIALASMSLCVYLLCTTNFLQPNPTIPLVLGLSISDIPFIFALYQTFKLLTYVDKKIAFSDLSVMALQKIKYCAIGIGILYAVGEPYLFMLAQKEDAPGLVLFGGIIACACFVVAVLLAVLQKLLRSAIDLKTENDLTV
ncbi:MAG: DUF2975 domain-containing protein [Candidatus Pacebacteria bacterium]|nr:DUF2975 domain-containing protein [Candidatus Paceibacterota bacterium]